MNVLYYYKIYLVVSVMWIYKKKSLIYDVSEIHALAMFQTKTIKIYYKCIHVLEDILVLSIILEYNTTYPIQIGLADNKWFVKSEATSCR